MSSTGRPESADEEDVGSPTPVSQDSSWSAADDDRIGSGRQSPGRTAVLRQGSAARPGADPDLGIGRAIDDAFLPPPDLCRRFWANDAYGRVVLDGEGTILWLNESRGGDDRPFDC